MDGEAFHRADRLIQRAEREGLTVLVDVGDTVVDSLSSVSLDALLRVRSTWTDRQLTVVRTYRRTGSQTATAEELDVSQQAVSRTLNRAQYNWVSTMETYVRDALEAIDDSG